MSSLCALLGFTRQAYYGQQKYQHQQRYEADLVIQQVLKHREPLQRVGTRKLLLLLQQFVKDHNIKLGRDALFDLLRENNLLIRRRKRTVQTTFSKHRYHKYPNLIRQYGPLAPNLLWVSDITYIVLDEGFAYLSLITDGYSRKIVGFCLWESLEAIGSVKALEMALAGVSDCSNLIHHSDRGLQYCCHVYVNILKSKEVKISMTENSDPLENAIAERVNGILKDELLKHKYHDFKAAQLGVARAIPIYNSLRLHGSCDMLTPEMAHQRTGELKKHWKNYYKKKEVIMAES